MRHRRRHCSNSAVTQKTPFERGYRHAGLGLQREVSDQLRFGSPREAMQLPDAIREGGLLRQRNS